MFSSDNTKDSVSPDENEIPSLPDYSSLQSASLGRDEAECRLWKMKVLRLLWT